MAIEGGGGLVFKIIPKVWLGLEAAAAPVFFGRSEIANSAFFHTLATVDIRF